jgi:hypothetical protein
MKSSELAGGLVDVAVLTVSYLAYHQDPAAMSYIFTAVVFSIVAGRAALPRDQLGKKPPPPGAPPSKAIDVVKNSATFVVLAVVGTSILHWLMAPRSAA